MDPDQAQALGQFIRTHRETQGVSTRQLAAQVGVDKSQIIRLEQGGVANPRADLLANIATALELDLADLYGFAGYTRPAELPSFVPYLRAKYRDLPDTAVADMERYFARLARRHGTTGPRDGEDER
jgi:transcriptional regulator with XRE-family HTH domain